jgi:Tol biopolymer transport system component
MTLVIREMESGTFRTLHPGLQLVQAPRWSPDGTSFLVKGVDVHGRSGCFLVDRETGKVLRRIVELGPVAERCIWSPDGRAIYYDRIGPGAPFARILERDVSSGREREIYRAEFPSCAVRKYASPDGRFLACSIRDSRDESTSLMLVPTDGSAPRELHAMDAPESPNAWGFSPDGRFVYFTVRKTNHVSEWDWELWRIATAGGEPEYLGLSVKGLRDVRVHPDGTKLAFTSGYGAKEIYALKNFFHPATSAP